MAHICRNTKDTRTAHTNINNAVTVSTADSQEVVNVLFDSSMRSNTVGLLDLEISRTAETETRDTDMTSSFSETSTVQTTELETMITQFAL
jgi:hypothetical protein